MNVSWSNGFAPLGLVWRQRQSAVVVMLVVEKTGSQEFLLSSTPLMPPYIVKMTWSCPKMSYPQSFIFIRFLANATTKFHISVIQWARKCYIAQKLFVIKFFQNILNTYNCRSQHPSAQWNLRGGRWSSAEYCTNKKKKKNHKKKKIVITTWFFSC